jgi:hypothetical protein
MNIPWGFATAAAESETLPASSGRAAEVQAQARAKRAKTVEVNFMMGKQGL